MEYKKKLVLVHGDKGGVGKSTLASLAIDYAIEHFGQVAVVEGDEKIDDVSARFAGVPGVQGFMVDLARPDASEEAIIALFEELENAGLPNIVVVNTPASASATLDRQAVVLVEAAHEMGYSIHVAWMLGPDDASAALSTESALCQLADIKVAVVNERFGDGKRFAWTRHAARQAWKDSGGLESALPCLTDRAITAVQQHPGRYTDLAAPGSALSTITRKYVLDWVRQAHAGPVALLFQDAGE
jgi:anion-transporting  ArsA/GET3 family ATPase